MGLLKLTGSSVSVSVSPAQSSPGVVQMGLSRTREAEAPLTDTIAKRRLRRLWGVKLLLEIGTGPCPRRCVNRIVFSSSSVSEFM
jgi:hypothetical protein